MINLVLGIFIRIFSNSFLNVFQKILTNKGESPSIINFYTYLGLTLIAVLICPNPIFTQEILINFFVMGFLGAIGNYFIIKALSCGELSSIAPINSYKPIVALLLGFFVLKEIPQIEAILGIILIILGTIVLAKSNIIYSKATLYRLLALIFSGSEAIFIKKIIILSDVPTSFLYWALASLIFTLFFAITSKHKIVINKKNMKYQIYLIIAVTLMQYSTNYVFSKMNVAYALALFQLSTLISIFLGVNIFNEKEFLRKITASVIMLIGATIIILS